MIPGDQKTLKEMEELAERNIANGDWGDESMIPGLPGETVPTSPEETETRRTVSRILASRGSSRLPKRN